MFGVKERIGKNELLQFLDTSALIALSDRNDKNHLLAKEYLIQSTSRGVRFILSNHILIEFIDGVSKKINKEKAIEEFKNLLDSKLLIKESFTNSDFDKASLIFKKYKTQKIDLTDSLSFAIMERLEIKTVFTFDKDFILHGFIMVPG